MDRDAAASPTPLKPTEYEHDIAEITELIGKESELLPCAAQPSEVRFDALPSPEYLALDSPQPRRPLQIRSRELSKGVGVAPAEGVYRPSYDIDVLVRNKRSPRLQRWFERNALTESFELAH